MKYYLAIDIGASSGRGIVGWKENNQIITDEIYRFSNGVTEMNGHLIWNIAHLKNEVVNTIRSAFIKYREIESLSIDTWGVDYVLMNGEKEILPVYAYRDNRTENVIEEVHRKIPFEKLYERTGCQFQPFNTIYQLYDDLKNHRLQQATDFLMIPEYLMYCLTAIKVKEFTNATTTGMIHAHSLCFDEQIIQALALPEHLFKPLKQPGYEMGCLKKEVQQAVGGNCKVVLCATHDTGSAVEGIGMEGNELYISSGTWSLLGVKTDHPITTVQSRLANYSNEGGVGYNRYQKNIMGMWLVNQLQQELCPQLSIIDIVKQAEGSDYDELLDANDSSLLSPASMKNAFEALLKTKPATAADYFRCAYRSLALSYRKAIEELEENTGRHYEKLYIVGGGAKNQFLNKLTQQYTNKEVIALPIEATAIGNLIIQMNKGEQKHE